MFSDTRIILCKLTKAGEVELILFVVVQFQDTFFEELAAKRAAEEAAAEAERNKIGMYCNVFGFSALVPSM